MKLLTGAGSLLLVLLAIASAQEGTHEHPPPEKLGKVSFANSCAPGVQPNFIRAVALLHSFAYGAAEEGFHEVAEADPQCAMADWGEAMSQFHQLWEPHISPAGMEQGRLALERAQKISGASKREREYISALAPVFRDADSVPYSTRVGQYTESMAALAARYPQDCEAQIFYALALIATAPPDDATHRNQKKAAEILEPLYVQQPEHPGIAHYLIHAYDNAELAARGLPAARAYAQIAPAAPHALHMPSHIFTRLGMWSDSIRSNVAARSAAHAQGDIGEELHAMDYLVYAYLQSGRDAEAAAVLDDLRGMNSLRAQDFKVGYAATAMPVRYAVERGKWSEAAQCTAAPAAAPHVAAIAVWARAVGLARGGNPAAAQAEIETLRALEEKSRDSGNLYWAGQVHIQLLEASAWLQQAMGKSGEAAILLHNAADEEDAIEKRPVTPGPPLPAREQLADLLLEQGHAQQALTEYETSLLAAPGRRQALHGALEASERTGDASKIRQYRMALESTAP